MSDPKRKEEAMSEEVKPLTAEEYANLKRILTPLQRSGVVAGVTLYRLLATLDARDRELAEAQAQVYGPTGISWKQTALERLALLKVAQAHIAELEADSPGTPMGRLHALATFAETECGHIPLSAKPADVTICEWVTEAKQRIAEYESGAINMGAALSDSGASEERLEARIAALEAEAEQSASSDADVQVIIKRYMDDAERLRAALKSVEPEVCSLLCPSVRREDELEWTHSQKCQQVSKALSPASAEPRVCVICKETIAPSDCWYAAVDGPVHIRHTFQERRVVSPAEPHPGYATENDLHAWARAAGARSAEWVGKERREVMERVCQQAIALTPRLRGKELVDSANTDILPDMVEGIFVPLFMAVDDLAALDKEPDHADKA